MNIEELGDPKKAREVLDYLTLTSMKANYPHFVKEWGYREADKRMEGMFKRSWEDNKEIVWQWYDLEIQQIIDNA